MSLQLTNQNFVSRLRVEGDQRFALRFSSACRDVLQQLQKSLKYRVRRQQQVRHPAKAATGTFVSVWGLPVTTMASMVCVPLGAIQSAQTDCSPSRDREFV